MAFSGMFDDEGTNAQQFLSFKRPLIELLLRALTVETDSCNTQMLLGKSVMQS